jgi:hypothetical protein
MKTLVYVTLLLVTSVLLPQDGNSGNSQKHDSSARKDEVTVQGCVSRQNSDYILMKQDPGITYQLQSNGKLRLKKYLGQQVEITAQEVPTLSSSSDAMNKVGSASPVTLVILSIKTVNSSCSSSGVTRHE